MIDAVNYGIRLLSEKQAKLLGLRQTRAEEVQKLEAQITDDLTVAREDLASIDRDLSDLSEVLQAIARAPA